MRQPLPSQVRIVFKAYLRRLADYNRREISGFNKSGMASEAYMQRMIEWQREYLRKWGHLLTVNLKKRPELC